MSGYEDVYGKLKKAYCLNASHVVDDAEGMLLLSAKFLHQLEMKNKQAVIESLHDQVSFQQLPFPKLNSKPRVIRAVNAIFAVLSSWVLLDVRSVGVGQNTVTIERVESFGLLGMELILPGVMVLEFDDEKIVRITDHIDFLTCIVQGFIAPFRMLKKKIVDN